MAPVRDPVVADHGEVPRDPKPVPAGRPVEAERGGVDREHDRRRRARQGEQGFSGRLAGLRGERTGQDEVRVLFDAGPRKPAAETVEPEPAVLVPGAAVDECDAAVTERGQAVNGIRHRVL